MWRGMVGVALAAFAAAGADTVAAQSGSPAVRPEDAGVRSLIAIGMERSATFRDLNARLEKGDVIVYVRFLRCAGGVPACLLWAPAGAGRRILLVKLDRFGRSPDELTALLAHELQHANEVASKPEITDAASFGKAFGSSGWKHADGFETGEAKEISRRVASELSRAERDVGRERRSPWTYRE